MTRSQLISVAEKVIKAPLEITQHKCGVTYSGVYLKREIEVYTTFENIPLAVIYNRVCYLISPTTNRRASELSYLYRFYNCTTKVALYPSKHYTFSDQDGEVIDRNSSYNVTTNYAALIPIPFTG